MSLPSPTNSEVSVGNRFDHCLAYVLLKEGGCCNVSGDRGGRTAYGITQSAYFDYRSQKCLPPADVWMMKPAERREIYFDSYWDAAKCPRLPSPLDIVVFDAAVQHGPTRSVKWLQRALGVTEDGAIGPHTLNAIEEESQAGTIGNLCRLVLTARGAFYRQIIERDETQRKFEKGWANRLLDIAKEAGVVL